MNAAVHRLDEEAGEIEAVEFAGFVSDQGARETLRAVLTSRWPDSVLQSGGAGVAAAYLAGASTPKRLLVDLSESSDVAAEVVELRQLCGSEPVLIVLGRENDLGVYRKILKSGADEYLALPVEVSEIDEAMGIVRKVSEVAPPMAGDATFVVGTRGGAGASLVALNAAWMAANRHKKKTMLVDLDVHFGTVALDFDLAPGRGLVEALQSPSRAETLLTGAARVQVGQRLSILATESPLNRPIDIGADALIALMAAIAPAFDSLWFDLPRHAFLRCRPAIAKAGRIILVSELSLAGMRDTYRLLQECREVAPDVETFVILNGVAGGAHELPQAEFERGIEGKVDHVLPLDVTTASGAAASGKPLAEIGPRSELVRALEGLADHHAGRGAVAEKHTLMRRLFARRNA